MYIVSNFPIGTTHQPSPPRLNCHTKNSSSFCTTGLPENFCQGLPAGRYKHPSFCSKFVLCNGNTADVQDCGRRLVYNPWIQNCAWPHSYRCEDANFRKHLIDICKETFFNCLECRSHLCPCKCSKRNSSCNYCNTPFYFFSKHDEDV